MHQASFYNGLLSELQKAADELYPNVHNKEAATPSLVEQQNNSFSRAISNTPTPHPYQLLSVPSESIDHQNNPFFRTISNTPKPTPKPTPTPTPPGDMHYPALNVAQMADLAVTAPLLAAKGLDWGASQLHNIQNVLESAFNPAYKPIEWNAGGYFLGPKKWSVVKDIANYGNKELTSIGKGSPVANWLNARVGPNAVGKKWGWSLNPTAKFGVRGNGLIGGTFNAQDLANDNTTEDIMSYFGKDPEKNPYTLATGKTALQAAVIGLGALPTGASINTTVWLNKFLLELANTHQEGNVGDATKGLSDVENVGGSSQLASTLFNMLKQRKNPNITNAEKAELIDRFNSPEVQTLADDTLNPGFWAKRRLENFRLTDGGSFWGGERQQEMGPSKALYDRLEKMLTPGFKKEKPQVFSWLLDWIRRKSEVKPIVPAKFSEKEYIDPSHIPSDTLETPGGNLGNPDGPSGFNPGGGYVPIN